MIKYLSTDPPLISAFICQDIAGRPNRLFLFIIQNNNNYKIKTRF